MIKRLLYALVLLSVISYAEKNTDDSINNSMSQPELLTDVAIGEVEGTKLFINIALPGSRFQSPRPVILLIHGGGFISGNKNAKNSHLVQLAQGGYVAASAMYRLAPKHKFPAAIEDVKLAIRFLKANAKMYQINPNKIIVSGSSAGGYLAVMIGVTGNSGEFSKHEQYTDYDSTVRAVTAQSAPTGDFTLSKYSNSKMVERLLDQSAGDIRQHLIAMSPLTYLDSSDPPFFLAHGDNDPIVPVDMSREFVAQLELANHSYEYHEVAGGTHSLKKSVPDKAKRVYRDYLDFLAKWSRD